MDVEVIKRVAAIWVKNGLSWEDFWKYERHIEIAILAEEAELRGEETDER